MTMTAPDPGFHRDLNRVSYLSSLSLSFFSLFGFQVVLLFARRDDRSIDPCRSNVGLIAKLNSSRPSPIENTDEDREREREQTLIPDRVILTSIGLLSINCCCCL